jgi:formylglycine-generating enzyme
MKVLITVLILAVMLCLISCDKKTTDPNTTANIELLGTWTGTIEDNGNKDINFTFSDSTLNILVFPDEIQKANIVTYDNETNMMVVFWTIHPSDELVGTYMKIMWSDLTATSVVIQPYQPQATQAMALTAAVFGSPIPLSKVAPNSCSKPIFNPTGGTYALTQNVTIYSTTSGANIYYSIDGSNPSIPYTSPISISASSTLKAKATKQGMTDSPITSAMYTIGSTPAEMILVPGGTYTMGRTNGSGDDSEIPVHIVTLSSFRIGKYEVTQDEWESVMGEDNKENHALRDNYPGDSQSWYEILVYCNLRSIAEGLTPVFHINDSTNPTDWGNIPTVDNIVWNNAICDWTATGYRLPTEAEWEFAARGGTATPDNLYSGGNDIDLLAWYGLNSGYETHPVGLKQANALGIYDMSGNVWEWCWDWSDSYTSTEQTNPTGPNSGTYRIVRGGRCSSDEAGCRVYSRMSAEPRTGAGDFGFRLCRSSQ